MISDTFLSCDWGTSNFRLRWVRSNDLVVLGEISNSEGIAHIYSQWKNEMKSIDRMDFFINKLLFHIDQLEKQFKTSLEEVPLLVSGMASSSIGFKELPYKKVPYSLENDPLIIEAVRFNKDPFKKEFQVDNKSTIDSNSRIDKTTVINKELFNHLFLVSGICSNNDVIRGEETLLLGAYDESKIASATFIFPGTHSKHVYIENGIARDFKTFMTGEVFKLLSQLSILADSVEKNDLGERMYFQKGVQEGASSNLLNIIFQVRTNQVFKKNSPRENYQFLSGLLIGYELSDLIKNSTQNIILVSGETLKEQYLAALQTLGIMNVKFVNADTALVKGHSKILQAIAIPGV